MLFDQPETLDPGTILDWHGLCASGLSHERRDALACLENQTQLPAFLASALPVGSTRADIDDHFRSCQQELDLAAILALIASAEARVRLDAQRRTRHDAGGLAGRLAVLHSQALRDWHVPLYEDGIMDAWKTYAGTLACLSRQELDRILTSIGGLKDVLRVRHWVAHGRYWQFKRDIRSYPPATVAQAINALYAALGDIARHGGLLSFG